MTDTTNNLEHWNKHASVPAEYRSEVGYGKRQFTSWDATWAWKEATKIWGPYGLRWGLRHMVVTPIVSEKGATEGFQLIATFFCPLEGGIAFQVINDWPYNRNNGTLKSLETNTVKKALSRLGWAADLYLGKGPPEGEDDGPVPTDPKHRTPSAYANDAIASIKTATTSEQIDRITSVARAANLSPALMGTIYDAVKARYEQIKLDDSAAQAEDVIGEANYGKEGPEG